MAAPARIERHAVRGAEQQIGEVTALLQMPAAPRAVAGHRSAVLGAQIVGLVPVDAERQLVRLAEQRERQRVVHADGARRDVDLVGLIRRAPGRIEGDEIRVLAIAIGAGGRQLAVAIAVPAGLRDIAVVGGRPAIEGPVAAAAIARRALEVRKTQGARQAVAVLVMRGAQRQFERIVERKRVEPHGAGLLVDELVVAIAVAVDVRAVHAEGERAEFGGGVQAVVVAVEGATSGLHVELRCRARAAFGDEVDHAAHRPIAITHGVSAAHDLDALDLRQGNRGEVGPREVVGVEPHAVDHHQHVAGGRCPHAADVEGRELVRAEEALQVHVRFAPDQIDDAGRGGGADFLRADDRDAAWRCLQRAFDAARRDHDFVELGRIIGRQRIRRRAHCEAVDEQDDGPRVVSSAHAARVAGRIAVSKSR